VIDYQLSFKEPTENTMLDLDWKKYDIVFQR